MPMLLPRRDAAVSPCPPRRPLPPLAAAQGATRALFASLGLCFAASLSAAPQQAEPTPPLGRAARSEGAAAKGLDAATVNLDWENVAVADLPLLARFPGLRRLQVNPETDAGIAAWQAVTADALAPVCALTSLEDLTLPYCAHLSAEHLRRLAACKRLASVMFINENLTLDAEVAGALATWPALRSLRLALIEVTPAGLAALAKIPNLESLELANCRGLDAAGIEAVGKLANLRVLGLGGVGRPDMLARMRGQDAPPAWALTMAAMEQIAQLPALRELELVDCTLAPQLLLALPEKLVALELRGHDVDVQALQDLRKHGALRSLRLSEAGATEAEREQFGKAVAGLLGVLRLERFGWLGSVAADLREAIASQADLRELSLPCDPDLGFAAALPKLERLDLWPRAEPPTAAELGVLQASKSLRIVAYHDTKLAGDVVAELRKALGARIALQIVE